MTDFVLDMSEFLDLFIDESQQNLQMLNRAMLALEHDGNDGAALEEAFRASHTLKGMAAAMGYSSVSRLAHALEDRLDLLRSHSSPLTQELVSAVFGGIDAIELLVRDIAEGGSGDGDVMPVLDALAGSGAGDGGMPRAPKLDSGLAPRLVEELADDGRPVLNNEPAALDNEPAALSSEPGAERESASHVWAATDAAAAAGAPPSVDLARSGPSRLVRLDVQRLDRLVDVVAEMVIHRSYLTRLQVRLSQPELDAALATHSRMLDQLQAAVLDTRMVPVGHAFDRFPRMVRDVLKSQGKEADLVIRGGQVELDRTVLSAINDSLVHLLRNAIDHGLETPEERIALGKARSGRLSLSAQTVRNSVVIEVSDDGRGIDVGQIAARALDRGFVSRQNLADMTEGQVLRLLCEPGFTLADEVTSVSGRGVGMGVVQAQVRSMRGRLEIETELGQGTTFRLRLPVNLALTDAILVQIGTESYVVPTCAVERVVEVEGHMVSWVGKKMLLALPDGVVEFRNACVALGGAMCTAVPPYALVSQVHDQVVSVGIDAVLGYEQIVAKPVPPPLAGIPGISGATILGEGRVVFILDLTQL